MTATNSTDINDWPLSEGDYILGRPDSPVAIVTLASDYRKLDLKNHAICGTCFTENFGIQKVIVNILSNPKISCLIVCGKESSHFAGQSILALVENGVSTLGGYKKIIVSRGGDPISGRDSYERNQLFHRGDRSYRPCRYHRQRSDSGDN